MSFQKKLGLQDVFFIIQIAAAIVFCGSQCREMLKGPHGVSIMWFASWVAFSSFNFALTWRFNKNVPSSTSRQLLWSYGVWGGGALCCIAVMLLTKNGSWGPADWINLSAVTGGVAITVVCARARNLPVLPYPDPMVKGWLAVCFKTLPQLVMTATFMLTKDSHGLSAVSVWLGHVTVWIRLGQLIRAYAEMKKKGQIDRSCKGSLLSEICNESSWILVTIAWLIN